MGRLEEYESQFEYTPTGPKLALTETWRDRPSEYPVRSTTYPAPKVHPSWFALTAPTTPEQPETAHAEVKEMVQPSADQQRKSA